VGGAGLRIEQGGEVRLCFDLVWQGIRARGRLCGAAGRTVGGAVSYNGRGVAQLEHCPGMS
jgi:hypothetical protein